MSLFYLYWMFCFPLLPSGPAAFCQRSQCSVPFTLPTQHAEQSGARSAALEEAGPGAEEVCVRPPCCSQLKPSLSSGFCRNKKTKTEGKKKTLTVTKSRVFTVLFLFLFIFKFGFLSKIFSVIKGICRRKVTQSSYFICRQQHKWQWFVYFCTDTEINWIKKQITLQLINTR